MINTVNNLVTVQRWTETAGESSFTNNDTNVYCYIEPWEFDSVINVDWENFADVFVLFSNNTDIIIWDKIIDRDLISYKVKWTKVFDSFLWTHIEATILKVYD